MISPNHYNVIRLRRLQQCKTLISVNDSSKSFSFYVRRSNFTSLKERIEEIQRQRPETRTEILPNDALGVVFDPEHPGRVRGLGIGAVPTAVFKQTSRRGGCSYMGAASTSAPPPQWVQEMANMRSQLNVLTSLFQMKIGNIPEEFAHLFPTPSQAPNLGDGVPSPTGPRRSFDGSNYENGASNN
uniref:Uncharacterized protein n=1 Tax=Nicotiana tabacum TaxID=4097 RepID=A0A1S3WZS0_TOBAC|nr:PREDICTED: uncharacterized protein LOC107759662 [Nicotiana tabacum]